MKTLREAIMKSTPAKLDAGTRRKGNDALVKHGLDGNGRFRNVADAMNHAWMAIGPLGLEPGNSVPYTGGKSGTFSQDLRWTNKEDSFSPVDISNSVLYVQWAKLESGYEVVAYLS
jgi:hypothetical protein